MVILSYLGILALIPLLVEKDDRVPFVIGDSCQVLSLNHVNHVGIPVVVVTYVLVVEVGHSAHFKGSIDVRVIPFRQEIHAVGIGKDKHQYGVFPDKFKFRIFGSHHVVSQKEVLLCRCALRSVKASVNVYNGLSFS